MKKIKYLLFTLFLCLFISNVSAASVSSVKYEGGSIKVDGTGTTSTQVSIFNSNKDVVYFGTVSVKNGKYSFVSPKIAGLAAGKYDIKVADYEGTNSESDVLDIKSHNIYIKDNEFGTVSTDTLSEYAIKNKKVTITSSPKEGYELKSLEVFYYSFPDDAVIDGDRTDMNNVLKYVNDAVAVNIDVVDNTFVLPDLDINYNVVINPVFEKIINPKTLDNIITYVGFFAGSLLALCCLAIYLKKIK